jgi:acyl carrier protein
MEEKKIVDFLTELGAENITPTSELRDDLGLDSLQMVILLIALEDIFEIELEEADIDPGLLVTVEDVISLTKKYTQPSEENTNE